MIGILIDISFLLYTEIGAYRNTNEAMVLVSKTANRTTLVFIENKDLYGLALLIKLLNIIFF